jgi:hypothetical protein
MRIHDFAPLLIALSLVTIGAGCGQKSSSDQAAGASSAPGTPVRQPLGVSSASGAGSAKPAAPAH